MMFGADHAFLLDRLEQDIRTAVQPRADLFSRTVSICCGRIGSLGRRVTGSSIARLIELEAWTEAALAFVTFELPAWKLRRLIYDDGVWVCTLSLHPYLPLGLDDSAEATHESLPLFSSH
jgi:hypothetical protein